jgi:hypothetical protein
MLVECGFTRAQMPDGREFTFRPSFARIAALGSPPEIVQLYADLHGPRAAGAAGYILATLCDQDDCLPLIGWIDRHGRHGGAMPQEEQIILARHLMRHGIVGKARPGSGGGQYAQAFHAAEYIAAARVHLGLSSADAEALSMTEFQIAFEMKFPDSKAALPPSRAEYRELMEKIEGGKRG